MASWEAVKAAADRLAPTASDGGDVATLATRKDAAA